MATYSYPPFPTFGNGIGGFFIALLEWLIEVPFVALANFIAGVTGAVTNGTESSAGTIIGFIGDTWANSVNSFQQFGIAAPILASLVWGVSILILIFFIFKAVQLSLRETEED